MSIFRVSDECRELGLQAGAIVLRNVKISRASTELRLQIDDEIEVIRDRFASAAEIRAISKLVKLHEILRAVGVKPRNHPPSTQKLFEHALNRGILPAIYNFAGL